MPVLLRAGYRVSAVTQAYFPEQRVSGDLVFGYMVEGGTAAPALTSISLTASAPTGLVGATVTTALSYVLNVGASVTSTTYTSSDTAKATVSSGGVVTIVAPGPFTITVEVEASGSGLATNTLEDTVDLIAYVHGAHITLNFTTALATVDGRYVTLPFATAVVTTPELFPLGIVPGSFGTATLQGTASFTPTGWDSSAYGTPTVFNYHQFISVAGSSYGALGAPTVVNWHQYVTASGLASTIAFGTSVVYNYDQDVLPSSIAPPSQQVSIGAAIFDPLQYVSGVGGISAPSFPVTHYVADYYQDIDLNGFGTSSHAVPTPEISHRVRTIEVPFFVNTYYGTPHVEDNAIRPSGWRSSVVGVSAVVELGTRTVTQHSSTKFSEFGTANVQLLRQYIRARPASIPSFGTPEVQNLTRYVYAGPYSTNSPPNVLGDYAWVKNRNVTLIANSFVSTKFGSRTATFVENAARQILPVGIDAGYWGSTDISHWIRTVSPAGFDSFVSRHWHVVYNNAVVIAPTSAYDGAVGRPAQVYNLNQFVRPWTVGNTALFGAPFVAPRIRTLTQFNSYPHLTGYFGQPSIRFRLRPIAPVGFVPEYPLGVPRPNGLFGAVLVRGPFIPTIKPNSAIGPEVFSAGATVRNRNRVIRPPAVSRREEFGSFATVELYTRTLSPVGLNSMRIGAHTVRDRTQRTSPATLSVPTFPVSHWVRNLSPDPPSLQYLFVGAWETARVAVPSSPVVRFPTIYPLGLLSTEWGSPTVYSTTIKVDTGISNLDQLGVPWVAGAQFLALEGFKDSVEPPKQRVSPHTIYAPAGDRATAQARANHPTNDPPQPIGPEVTGLPDVSHRNRTIYAIAGAVYSAYGDPQIDLRMRYVYPVQIRSLRMGRPVILGVTQYIDCNTLSSGFDASSLGAPDVARVRTSPEYLAPASLNTLAVGTLTISNFVRTIEASGVPHRGNPQEGQTNPWGLPEIGYPRTIVLSGFNSLIFGTHRVEHRIRELPLDGFDSCSFNEEDIPSFNLRMRVKGRRIVVPSSILSTESVSQPSVT